MIRSPPRSSRTDTLFPCAALFRSDLLSAIAGEFASDQDIGSGPFVVGRDDGSLLIAGSMPADQMAERLGIELGEDRDYATAAGHALAILKHLLTAGETFTDKGWRFELVDMDGRKIEQLLVPQRSDERRVGNESVSKCRLRA